GPHGAHSRSRAHSRSLGSGRLCARARGRRAACVARAADRSHPDVLALHALQHPRRARRERLGAGSRSAGRIRPLQRLHALPGLHAHLLAGRSLRSHPAPPRALIRSHSLDSIRHRNMPTMSKVRTVAYWFFTLVIAWEMVAGSMWDLLRIPFARGVFTHL